VRQATEGRGADVALDLVGGSYLPETLAAMAHRGTVMLVGLTAGRAAEVPLGLVLTQRLKLVGTTLRARAPHERAALARRLERAVLPLFATGKLEPVVGQVRPMSEAPQALEQLSGNETFGKTVLTW
jgi:NADPH:quinone reductase-like Zn-dependent oxidoreductase